MFVFSAAESRKRLLAGKVKDYSVKVTSSVYGHSGEQILLKKGLRSYTAGWKPDLPYNQYIQVQFLLKVN